MNATGGASDFDFFIGRWSVVNEQLKKRFCGCDEWDTFAATSVCRKLLGGLAHIDEIDIPAKAMSGINLAAFNPGERIWSLHWMDNKSLVFFPPLTGRFENGIGTFHGDDTDGGRPVGVRFLWMSSATAPRWEQAFSIDGGKSWETNWVMKFTRAD